MTFFKQLFALLLLVLALFSFTLVVVTPVWIPAINPYVYAGIGSPTVWHNPTQQLIMLVIFLAQNLGNPEANWQPWYMIILGVFSIVGIGIREECIYRATLQNIVAKKHANSVKGVWVTVTIGAVIFGLSHIPNLFFGMEPLAVLTQVIYATVAGLLFGAVYLRSGSLWALVLVHTLTDTVALAQSTFLRNISDVEEMSQNTVSGKALIVRLIYIGIAAFLLRPSKCKQICESLCFADDESEAATRT